jgi:hypothetical protein
MASLKGHRQLTAFLLWHLQDNRLTVYFQDIIGSCLGEAASFTHLPLSKDSEEKTQLSKAEGA